MIKLFYSKKGVSLALEAFIGFVLATLAMMIIVYIGVKLGGLLVASSIDPATESNFKTLVKTINSLSSSDKEKDTIRNFPLYLGENYILVAFPKGYEGVKDECYAYFSLKMPSLRGEENILRPLKCGIDACLCLYKNGVGYDDLEKEQPLICQTLNKVDFVYSTYYQDEKLLQANSGLTNEVLGNLIGSPTPLKLQSYGGWIGRYQNFILYGGGCFNGALGIQKYYLDMHKEESKTLIFIAGESLNSQSRWDDLIMGYPGFSRRLDKKLEELLGIIKSNSDPYQVRNAIITVLSSQEMIDNFIKFNSEEEFRNTFFAKYIKNIANIPSLTENRIKNNAAKVWEQYSLPLMKLGIPYLGKDNYVQTCVVAFVSGRENNDCWVPKHINLNS